MKAIYRRYFKRGNSVRISHVKGNRVAFTAFVLVVLSLIVLNCHPPYCLAQSSSPHLIRAEMPAFMPDGYPVLSDESRALFRNRWSSRLSASMIARDKVALIVDSPLYSDISGEIDVYINDVQTLFPVDLLLYKDQSWREKTHQDVRIFLQTLHKDQGIEGAVLVGFFPFMIWELDDDTRYPVVLNYMDLDGLFLDMDADGCFDTHNWNDNGIEIYIGWMRPYQAADESVEYTAGVVQQMREYLNKAHDYYDRKLVFDKEALIYVNEPWWWCYNEVKTSAEMIYGSSGTHVIGGEYYYAFGDEYLQLKASGKELVNIWCHSSGYAHYFDQGPHNVVWADDLDGTNGANGIITILWACHGSDYSIESGYGEPKGCLGARYAFEGNSLASIGVSRSGYTYGMELIIEGLALGGYLGEVYLDSLNTSYDHEQGFAPKFQSEVFAQTLFGNPFIYADATTDMSAPAASISGNVVWNSMSPVENARVLVQESGNTRCSTNTDSSGNYTVSPLPPGSYTVEVITPLNDFVTRTGILVSSGSTVTGINFNFEDCSQYNNIWKYISNVNDSTELPADWNGPLFNADLWETGITPFLQHGIGTELLFGPQIYLRKNFMYDGTADRIMLNISADNGPAVWVNGTRISLPLRFGEWYKPRSGLDYWSQRIDITSYVKTGQNYVVVAGWDYWIGNYLDVSLYAATDTEIIPLADRYILMGIMLILCTLFLCFRKNYL